MLDTHTRRTCTIEVHRAPPQEPDPVAHISEPSPGNLLNPVVMSVRQLRQAGPEQPTAVGFLLDYRLDTALVRLGKLLKLESGACVAEAAAIHCLLQGVALPPEDVITMLAVPGAIHTLASAYWRTGYVKRLTCRRGSSRKAESHPRATRSCR